MGALRADDGNYALLEARIASITKRRNEIASQMIAILENAAFAGASIDSGEAERLILEASALLKSAL